MTAARTLYNALAAVRMTTITTTPGGIGNDPLDALVAGVVAAIDALGDELGIGREAGVVA